MNVLGFEIEVVLKRVKSITLKVKYGSKFIVVAPIGTSDERIFAFIKSQGAWLEKMKNKYDALPYFPTIPQEGEKVILLGKKFEVKIQQAEKAEIRLSNTQIIFYETSKTNREKLYDKWKKDQLNRVLDKLMCKWCNLTGLRPAGYTIKKVKSRWGWCNTKTKMLGFSLHLIYQPVSAIEYVILHELTHLLYLGHNADFYNHVKRYMPEYKKSKKLLVMPC